MPDAVVPLRPKDLRFAALAAVLSRAANAGDMTAVDAARVLRHQLRVRNTNKGLVVPRRSRGAQAVIDRYAREAKPIPKNGSIDALHCDHVWTITAADLAVWVTPAAWLAELPRLDEVTCVTAAENYRLQPFEKAGHWGWKKYKLAGVEVFDVATGRAVRNRATAVQTRRPA